MKIHLNKFLNLLIKKIINNYLMILLIITAILSLLFELHSFPKIFVNQTNFLNQAPSWKQLYLNPSNLIIKIILKVIDLGLIKNFYLIKIIFSLLVFLAFILIVKIIKQWYGIYLALCGGILYISSFWILESARFISYSGELLLLIPSVLIIKNYLNNKNLKLINIYLSLLTLMIIFFIPGAIFYIISFIALSIKNIIYHLKQLNLRHKIILTLLSLIFIIYNFIIGLTNHHYWLDISGLAKLNFNFSRLLEILKLFVTSPNSKSLFVSSQPLVGILITIMFLLGLAYFIKNISHSNRSQTMIVFLIITILMTVTSFSSNLSNLINLIYLISLTGLAYFLQIWLKTFPYNQFAKIGGYSLITLAVLITVFFGYRQFFVAYKYSHINHASSLISQP